MIRKGRILIVDDDPAICTVLEALLRQAGHSALTVDSGAAALALLEVRDVDVVLSDVKMPGIDGMTLLDRLVDQRPDLPVVLLTAHGTVAMAVDAMKRGAADFLLKPFDREEILFVIGKVLAMAARRTDPPELPVSRTLIGESPAMRTVHDMIRRAARGSATVLIRGESGTGKELIARAIHDASARRDRPLVKLHCAALPEALLESELFGYEKGAFTGASARKPGRIELAQGGTLFLDEVGDIPAAMQIKLLRVIQEREFERLGGTETIHVDVRLLAATHRELESMVAKGLFREDLYYRLNVVPLWLPPLRDRAGDIVLLARHFCAIHGQANQQPGATLDAGALEVLASRPWPGNIRQLENFIERLVVLSDRAWITADDVYRELERDRSSGPVVGLPVEEAGQPCGDGIPGGSDAVLSLDSRLRRSEREALAAALAHARNNRTLAARLLGVSRRTLYTKLEDHGLL
jgi:two-component system, NtrC family, response regulator AtoC